MRNSQMVNVNALQNMILIFVMHMGRVCGLFPVARPVTSDTRFACRRRSSYARFPTTAQKAARIAQAASRRVISQYRPLPAALTASGWLRQPIVYKEEICT